MTEVSLEQFKEMLKKHDWLHMFSDSDKVSQAGEMNEKKLEKIAKQSEAHFGLYSGYTLARHYQITGIKE